MYLKKNLDIVQKIREADFQGQSKQQMKPLYIEQNAFDVDLDTPIYRVMELQHLYADVSNNVLTHVKACKETWGDDYENPLLQVEYTEEVTGEKLTLAGIVDDFYGLSWTYDDVERSSNWQAFSYGREAVRIKSTPRKLLNALMSLDDNFFMLHHYIGKVNYYDADDLVQYFKQTHYEHHLDSLGQGAVLSLMALRNCFESEQEVRLLYSYDPSSNDWVAQNVAKPQGLPLCRVPINWAQILDEVVLAPGLEDSTLSSIRQFLSTRTIKCLVKSSALS
ncbi:hypothetical protein [Vibrio diabolicus]|uniref:hypothetical protein n=1 Tax=Vibrio diabolicus TaxID=50719 RepID=UPI0035A86339